MYAATSFANFLIEKKLTDEWYRLVHGHATGPPLVLSISNQRGLGKRGMDEKGFNEKTLWSQVTLATSSVAVSIGDRGIGCEVTFRFQLQSYDHQDHVDSRHSACPPLHQFWRFRVFWKPLEVNALIYTALALHSTLLVPKRCRLRPNDNSTHHPPAPTQPKVPEPLHPPFP